MTKTIKLNETSLVGGGSSLIKFLRKDNATHVLWQKWDGDEIVILKRWKMEEMLDPDGPINYSKFWNTKYDNDGFLTFTNLHKPKGPFGFSASPLGASCGGTLCFLFLVGYCSYCFFF